MVRRISSLISILPLHPPALIRLPISAFWSRSTLSTRGQSSAWSCHLEEYVLQIWDAVDDLGEKEHVDKKFVAQPCEIVVNDPRALHPNRSAPTSGFLPFEPVFAPPLCTEVYCQMAEMRELCCNGGVAVVISKSMLLEHHTHGIKLFDMVDLVELPAAKFQSFASPTKCRRENED